MRMENFQPVCRRLRGKTTDWPAFKEKRPVHLYTGRLFGAGCRIRTGHLMITSQLLYLMS